MKPTLCVAGLAAVAVSLTGCAAATRAGSAAPTHTSPGATATASGALVVAVIDGDTIKVEQHGRVQRVRLLGINAPEIPHAAYGKTHGQCGGEAARKAADRLLYRQRVTLTRDPAEDDTDRYGRLLRYVGVNGRDAGLELLRQGHATEYHPRSAQPEARSVKYRAAETQARRQHAGQWRTCDAADETKAPSTPEGGN